MKGKVPGAEVDVGTRWGRRERGEGRGKEGKKEIGLGYLFTVFHDCNHTLIFASNTDVL
jgi:hypothetical protein